MTGPARKSGNRTRGAGSAKDVVDTPARARTAGAQPSLRPKKTATLIAQRIADEITERQLEPGMVLPPERDMLVEYGVGRGSLREALRLLELHGIISIKPGPGGGPVVSEPNAMLLANSLAPLLQVARTPFRAIVEARMLLEPQMAAQAAARATPEQIESIAQSVSSMEDRLDDIGNFLRENARFHDLVAASSGNAVFRYVLTSLHWITDGTPLGVEYDEGRRKAVTEAHARIYRAIKARNAVTAHDAMERHLREFTRYIERFYPRLMERPIRWEQITG
jgi:DNA-binding FadR family transcriptional regulator